MTEVAGEVCDGILVHGFTNENYLRNVTLPALEEVRESRQEAKTLRSVTRLQYHWSR